MVVEMRTASNFTHAHTHRSNGHLKVNLGYAVASLILRITGANFFVRPHVFLGAKYIW